MSLLDDVSIVVTPNGYKEGELYAVIPVPTEGAELVTNGDFATDSDWNTSATGISIAGGKLSRDATATLSIVQLSSVITPSVTYKITFEIVDYTSGTLTPRFGYNGTGGTAVSGVGTYTQIITKVDQNVIELYGTAFVGSIDNVSVKEYTSADMDVTRATAATRVDENGLVNYAEVIGDELVTCGDFSCAVPTDYWTATNAVISFANNQITVDDTAGAGGDSRATQNFPTISGRVYRVKINRISTTTSFWLSIGNGTSFNNIKYLNLGTDTGEYTTEFTALGSSSTIALQVGGSGVSVFSDVTVKEVTRDNVPRIDYTGGGCPHILAEPQRTNRVTNSDQFSGSETNVSVLRNQIISPDGSLNADRIIDNNIFGEHLITGSFTGGITSGLNYTSSAFFKSDGTNGQGVIRFFTGAWEYAVFNLVNGTISYTSSGVSKIENYGNGWYRCSLKVTAVSNHANTITQLAIGNSLNQFSYQGASNLSYYFWGAQLEEGSYPTSYIPTVASSVTRNQDIFTRDGIGSLINSTEGVLFVEMAALANDSTQRAIGLSNGTADERIAIVYNDASNVIRLFCKSGGLTTSIIYSSATIVDYNKIAVKWNNGNDYALWVNGVEVGTSVTGNSFPADTLNELSFSFYGTNTPLYAKVKQLQVYDTALTDNQLIQLTGEAGTHFFESYAEMASALTYTIQ